MPLFKVDTTQPPLILLPLSLILALILWVMFLIIWTGDGISWWLIRRARTWRRPEPAGGRRDAVRRSWR